MSTPFKRFHVLMATIAQAMAADPLLTRMAALNDMGGYASRGKGKAKTYGPGNGSARIKRAALKLRNQRRHRARN